MTAPCDVCLVGELDSENSFYAETIHRARKAYRCCECNQPITPGERYQRATGKSDDHIWTYRTCMTCAEIRRVFYCHQDGGGWIFTTLWEQMQDQEVFERLTTASPCFQQLTPPAKAALMDRWRRAKGLR